MVLCIIFVIARSLAFFFSSRRRHTRFDCDWSSDVCSSDLTEEAELALPCPLHGALERDVDDAEARLRESRRSRQIRLQPRSEERRVGKECRCRWLPYH